MNLYHQYIKEVLNREVIETSSGFITYGVFGDECSVFDMYVIPEARRQNLCTEFLNLVEEIARTKNCKFISASAITGPGFNTLVKNGYTPVKETSTGIILKKDIK